MLIFPQSNNPFTGEIQAIESHSIGKIIAVAIFARYFYSIFFVLVKLAIAHHTGVSMAIDAAKSTIVMKVFSNVFKHPVIFKNTIAGLAGNVLGF